MMEAFTTLNAAALPIATHNLDTDRIVPARFLQKPRAAPFGDFLFQDWRRGADGQPDPNFAFNQAPYRAARIIVAARNFGCGSSREHAVWALFDAGFRCVIAPSFGDIFRSNAMKNGLLPVQLPEAEVERLLAALQAAPGARITVDLAAQQVTAPDGSTHRFEMEPFAKQCLLEGMDELGYTLTLASQVAAFERSYTY